MRGIFVGLVLVLLIGATAVLVLATDGTPRGCATGSSEHARSARGCEYQELWATNLAAGSFLYASYVLEPGARAFFEYKTSGAGGLPAGHGRGGDVEERDHHLLVVSYAHEVSASVWVGSNATITVTEQETRGAASYQPLIESMRSPSGDGRELVTYRLTFVSEDPFYAHLARPRAGMAVSFTVWGPAGVHHAFEVSNAQNWRDDAGTGTRMPAVAGGPGAWNFEFTAILAPDEREPAGLGVLHAPPFLPPGDLDGWDQADLPAWEPLPLASGMARYPEPWPGAGPEIPLPFQPTANFVILGSPWAAAGAA